MTLPNLNTGASSLSSLFSAPARTVEPPVPPTPEEPPVTETPSYIPVFSAKIPEKEPLLTAEEIKARAEVKARTLGAVILFVNALIECTKAGLSMKKGEYRQYLALKEEFNRNGYIADDDETRKMVERCERFDLLLASIEEEHELEDAEKKILYRAIKEDLERKNRENRLKDGSIAGAMLELLATRQLGSIIQTLTLGTRRWVEK